MKKSLLIALSICLFTIILKAQIDKKGDQTEIITDSKFVINPDTSIGKLKIVAPEQPNSKIKLMSGSLVIVNGEVCPPGLVLIDPKSIESLEVLKDQAALNVYGEAGKKGVILVTVVPEQLNSHTKWTSEALIIINGEACPPGLIWIDPKSIESLEVLKDQAALNIYGEAGKKGVILLTTN